MKELRDWLNDGDPVAHEPSLPDEAVHQMRRVIVAAGEPQESRLVDWARGSWGAATVVVALTIAVGVGRWWEPSPDVRSAPVETARTSPREPGARRQMQLIAPGGTRVIWIFNSDFEMKESGK